MVPAAGAPPPNHKRKADHQQGNAGPKKHMPPRHELEAYFAACSLQAPAFGGGGGGWVGVMVGGGNSPGGDHHNQGNVSKFEEMCFVSVREEPTDDESESELSSLDGRSSASQGALMAGFDMPADYSGGAFPYAGRKSASQQHRDGIQKGSSLLQQTHAGAIVGGRQPESDEWGWFVDAGDEQGSRGSGGVHRRDPHMGYQI